MSTLTLRVQTPCPGFANDVADVVRIFLGALEFSVSAPDAHDEAPCGLTVLHMEESCGGRTICRVRLSGLYEQAAEETYVPQEDALEDKRLHKRALKLAVYAAMKRATGQTPPWGSLTGIRPTRILYAAMEKGLTLEQAAAEAGEVFDISREKLALLEEIIRTQSALPPVDQRAVDLYVGIPFCVSRCAYCSFLSGEIGDGALAAPYVDALTHEISLSKALIDKAGLSVGAVYIGGGTPTALPAAQLKRVLDAVRPLAFRREFTVEAGRPDTIDREKLALIRDAGATRISINPQTMHDGTLRLIGRAHTAAQTEEAYALARDMCFNHINMDLIAGLPGENEEMFAQTLAWAKTLHPESLTVHTLSIKRSSLLHLWQAALPDGGMVGRMVQTGRDAAHEMSMRAYYLYRQKYMAGNLENVGYALPGHACRYNVHMMEETGHVLAMGAGAISKRVYPTGGKITRAPNVGDIAEYIARVDEMAQRKTALWADCLQTAEK